LSSTNTSWTYSAVCSINSASVNLYCLSTSGMVFLTSLQQSSRCGGLVFSTSSFSSGVSGLEKKSKQVVISLTFSQSLLILSPLSYYQFKLHFGSFSLWSMAPSHDGEREVSQPRIFTLQSASKIMSNFATSHLSLSFHINFG
jgi:hypothetical protein